MNYYWLRYINNLTENELRDNDIRGIFRISKGWSRHKYKDDYEYYTDKMVDKYGSLKEGKKYNPFHSAYETGLVFTMGNNGFSAPESAESDEEYPPFEYYKNLLSWQWLVNHAYLFGIYPNEFYPWRWEVQVPRVNWFSGNDFANSKTGAIVQGVRFKYCMYIVEESIETGRRTSDEEFNEYIFT